MTEPTYTLKTDSFEYIAARIEIGPVSEIMGTECWLWTLKIRECGYGYASIGGKETPAHRVVFQILVGDVPSGYHVDHLCRIRACVNPDHLEAVTPAQNILRGVSPAAHHARQTHCHRGHEFTAENTMTISTRRTRICRICRGMTRDREFARLREARAEARRRRLSA